MPDNARESAIKENCEEPPICVIDDASEPRAARVVKTLLGLYGFNLPALTITAEQERFLPPPR
jgi:hypothetical protein